MTPSFKEALLALLSCDEAVTISFWDGNFIGRMDYPRWIAQVNSESTEFFTSAEDAVSWYERRLKHSKTT